MVFRSPFRSAHALGSHEKRGRCQRCLRIHREILTNDLWISLILGKPHVDKSRPDKVTTYKSCVFHICVRCWMGIQDEDACMLAQVISQETKLRHPSREPGQQPFTILTRKKHVVQELGEINHNNIFLTNQLCLSFNLLLSNDPNFQNNPSVVS